MESLLSFFNEEGVWREMKMDGVVHALLCCYAVSTLLQLHTDRSKGESVSSSSR